MKRLILVIIWLHFYCIGFAQRTPSLLIGIDIPDTLYSNCIVGSAKLTNTGSVSIKVDRIISDCDNQIILYQRNWDILILKDSVKIENEYVTGVFQMKRKPVITLKPSHTTAIPINIPFVSLRNSYLVPDSFSIQLSYRIHNGSYYETCFSNIENFVFLLSK